MKKFTILLSILSFSLSVHCAYAQKTPVGEAYRRSSICMILMDESSMPNGELIREAFIYQPVPDKYNDHNSEVRMFCPDYYELCDADREAYQLAVDAANEGTDGKPQKKKGGFGKFMKNAAGVAMAAAANKESSTMVDSGDKEEYAMKAHKFLMEQQMAKQLFDRWFIDDYGDFTMEVIKERGMYDASVTDVKKAQSSVRGMAMLEDAGEELINNTFVVVSRYRYMSKEELTEEIDAAAAAAASLFGEYGATAAAAATAGIKASMGAGYYVRATSFLFQLKWNDEIANTFYTELWGDPYRYHNSDIFELKYIGQESAFANVKAGIFTNKPLEELVQIATINATDAVLAKLEKKYDVFKTKTPLLTAEPEITAYIGMKEGVEPGDKYEVLEKSIDPETGKTTYKRKTTVKAVKVWDNRYMAGEEQALTGEGEQTNATVFEGASGGLYPGMLLRQIK